jgi:hypothetical protein
VQRSVLDWVLPGQVEALVPALPRHSEQHSAPARGLARAWGSVLPEPRVLARSFLARRPLPEVLPEQVAQPESRDARTLEPARYRTTRAQQGVGASGGMPVLGKLCIAQSWRGLDRVEVGRHGARTRGYPRRGFNAVFGCR